MSAFQGLPVGLFEFFAELEQDNSKDFWNANRQRWQQDVKAPMSALVDELSTEFGPLRMFRPNRDLRFTQTSPLTSSGQAPPALLTPPAASATTSACRPPVSPPVTEPCG